MIIEERPGGGGVDVARARAGRGVVGYGYGYGGTGIRTSVDGGVGVGNDDDATRERHTYEREVMIYETVSLWPGRGTAQQRARCQCAVYSMGTVGWWWGVR